MEKVKEPHHVCNYFNSEIINEYVGCQGEKEKRLLNGCRSWFGFVPKIVALQCVE